MILSNGAAGNGGMRESEVVCVRERERVSVKGSKDRCSQAFPQAYTGTHTHTHAHTNHVLFGIPLLCPLVELCERASVCVCVRLWRAYCSHSPPLRKSSLSFSFFLIVALAREWWCTHDTVAPQREKSNDCAGLRWTGEGEEKGKRKRREGRTCARGGDSCAQQDDMCACMCVFGWREMPIRTEGGA